MRVGDPRGLGGPGIFPLQAWKVTWDIDKRPALLAYRLLDRLDGLDQLGHLVYEEASVGDIHGGQLLKKKDRPCPMWRFATPVVVSEKNKAGKSNDVASGGGNTGDVCATLSEFEVSPVLTKEYGPDTRLESFQPEKPKQDGKSVWPKFPRGYVGISLIADKETDQIDLFHPTDPRLVAVNRLGDALMGSIVCDMGPDFKLDPDRQARLQAMAWVIKLPSGCVDFFNANSIAWNLGPSGCRDVKGGLVIDEPFSTHTSTIDSKARVIGMMSAHATGPIDVGGEGDKHNIGTDADGRPINAAHASTNTLFRRNEAEDGPLNFTVWQPGGVFQKPAQVWCGFNPNLPHEFVCGTRMGKWDWWTTVPDYTPTVPPGRPTPPGDFPKFTPTPTGGGGGGDGGRGSVPTVQALVQSAQPQNYLARVSDTAFGSILGRAQMIRAGAIDLRKTVAGVPNSVMDANDRVAPVVARIEPFAKQLGQSFVYTDSPGVSRFVGGTAPGGFMVMPPELDMADDANSFAPPKRSASTTYFGVLSGSYFASGYPDLTTGAVKTGYRWGTTTAGVLTFDKINSAGAVTSNVVAMDANGRFGINTAAPATTFHAATANVRMDLTVDALSGGGAATLGGIGGTGPTRTTQDSWARINLNGTTYWLPLWI